MKKYIIELTDEELKELQKDLGLTDEEIKVMPEEDLARHIMSYKCRKTCRKLVKRDAEGYVSEELEYASEKYACRFSSSKYGHDKVKKVFIAGADWQKEHLWKPADGDDLPEIYREVIALLDNGKVVFAHRPPEYWDGKDIVTGKVTRNYPKTYDKGGWNIPNVMYWLDVELPKEIEL